jgi:hypothetical protein
MLAVLNMDRPASSILLHNIDQKQKARLTTNESILELFNNLESELAKGSACSLLHYSFFLAFLFNPDDGCDMYQTLLRINLNQFYLQTILVY